MRHRLYLFLVLLWSWVGVYAWEMVAKPFPFFYDLYSNEIYDVYQDREGLVWIGTTSSVSCYDGFRLRTFRSDMQNPSRLTNNRVRFIADSKTHVWITTESGITLYDKRTGLTAPIADERLASPFICEIKADGPDRIWIATDRHVYLSNADGTEIVERDPYEGGASRALISIYVDRERNLWVLARDGDVFRLRFGSDTYEKMPDFPNGGDALMMYQDREGNYWIGTWGMGLWQFEPDKEGGGQYFYHPIRCGRGEEESKVYGIVQDDCLGYLWVLAYNELHALKRTERGDLESIDITHVLDPHKMFTKVMKDRQGNLWLGSYDEGFIIHFDASGVTNYPLYDLKEKLGWDVNLVGLAADNHQIWLSQDRYGVVLYDSRTKQLHKAEDGRLGEVSFLAPSGATGKMWAASRFGGLVCSLTSDGDGVKVRHEFGLADVTGGEEAIRNITEGRSGELWVATPTKLIVSEQKKNRWRHVVHPLDGLSAMVSDKSGTIWCMAFDSLYECHYADGKVEVKLRAADSCSQTHEQVVRMSADDSGNLWMTTSAGRLMRYMHEEDRMAVVDSDSLWADGSIQDLLCTGNDVWMMTNKKLLCFDLQKDTVMVFEAGGDNVCVRAFRNKALCADGRGGVYAGGHNGFVHVTGKAAISHPQSYVIPKVTDVVVNGRSLYDVRRGDEHLTFCHVPLLPSDKNIEIHFSKWEYVLGRGNRLQFRLLGAEEEWNDFNGERPYAFYHRLPKGEYAFEVRMMQPDGSWGRAERLATIDRLPAWYETPIAFSVYGVLAFLILYMFGYYMLKRSRQKHEVELSQVRMHYITADHQLMNDMLAVVDRHIDDSTFDLDKLAEAMNMSKSTLHRKVKTSMGVTPLEFIHNVRLKRACDMLKKGDLTVSEIAYAVGFSTPKYFTKCFKQAFGITPSAYAGKQKDEMKQV